MFSSLFKQHDGPLTRDLVQSPASFGLGQIPTRLHPHRTVSSICGYCATGCQLQIHLDEEGSAINLSPQAGYPVNIGMACPKGWQALDPLDAPDRATTPLLRDESGNLQAIDWPQALTTFTTRLKKIQQQFGRESAAFLSTGQIPFEEMAFLGCLWKFGMGFLHGDANTRQCMATAVTAYKQAFGFDAPPATYADFEESDVILLVGSNLCIAHPILWQRVMRNQRKPQIIVIDPRATETAQAATQHLAIRPKSDLTLFYALAHCIIRDGRICQKTLAQCVGYDEFAAFVKAYTPAMAAERSGLDVATIEQLAQLVSDPNKRVSWWWTMGINQSYEGVRAAQAMINLCLITGQIGKPGTGPNSITGQCNAMGSRLFSNTTSLVGGHDFANPQHREKVARLLEIPLDRIPEQASLAYDEILDAAAQGKIKALWIVATNPFHSWVNVEKLRKLRENLDFLVVQDMYHSTESARVADLVLPASGWGEKDGCFINSERRIGTISQVRRAPGMALSDFRIFRLIAESWGCANWFSRWTDPESAFELLKNLTIGRPCDITGMENYDHIRQRGGIQWPYPAGTGDCAKERRLFEDLQFYHPDGKARLLFDPPSVMPEEADADYPLLLLTGRGSSSQWHTLSRTAKSDVLRKLCPAETYVEIHPADAHALNIGEQDTVTVQSRRGSMQAKVYLAPTMARGQVFLPMHDAQVNQLTHPSFDPHSRQPNYKACAVRLKKSSSH